MILRLFGNKSLVMNMHEYAKWSYTAVSVKKNWFCKDVPMFFSMSAASSAVALGMIPGSDIPAHRRFERLRMYKIAPTIGIDQ